MIDRVIKEAPGGRGNQQSQEYAELKRLITWVLASLIVMTVLTVITGILSDSLAIDAIAVDAGASMVLHIFNIITINIILRQNAFSHPYGTGKLENFSGFLYAAIVIPGAVLIIVSAANRYLAPPTTIDLGLPQALCLLWLLRDSALMIWSIRLGRRHATPSPMTQSYLINMKVTVVNSVAILAGLLFGSWMAARGQIEVAIGVDLLIAIIVSVYMFYCAIGLLVRNFQSLIDMPLPERDQYQIIHALVDNFDTYEGIGIIYTQLSGSTRIIQIELHVDPDMSAADLEALRHRIEGRLRGQFSRLLFHLIPLVRPPRKGGTGDA